MKKLEIKDNVDEMIVQIAKYIKACDLSEDEDTEIKLECALSFLISAINFTDNPTENIDYIIKQQADIQTIFMIESTKAIKHIIKGEYPAKRWKYDNSASFKSNTFR